MVDKNELENEARKIAKEYAEANPNVMKVYWFPDDQNKAVNLLSVENNYTTSADSGVVDVFVFNNQIQNENVPFSIGTISPQHENSKILPRTWGDWTKGVSIWENK